MRRDLGKQPAVFPMPVLMVAAYDNHGTVQVMNAAWGMICDMDKIALFIDDLHRGADSVLLDDIEALSVMIRDQGRSAIGFFYG